MHRLRLALRLLGRESRSGELTLLTLALLIAVTGLTTASLFADRLQRAMTTQTAEFLAADLVIESADPIPADWLAKARQLGLQEAQKTEFSSMLIENSELLLASVKAVSAAYPLRGQLKIADAEHPAETVVSHGPESGEAWVERRILSALKLNFGDPLAVGEKKLRITRILTYEPDQQGGFYSFSPRVMINANDLEATQVIQPGSHVHRFFQFSGDEQALTSFRSFVKPQLNPSQRLLDIHEDRPELGSALTRAEQFLGLSSIIVVIIAGVAIAMAARRYSERHFDASALLRCLGCTQREILRLYCAQFAVLGVVVGALGCGLGWLLQEGLFLLLRSLLPAQLPQPGLMALVFGVCTGLTILFGFALPPILRLKQVPPLRVLRHELEPLPSSAWLVYGLALTLICALVWRYTGDAQMTAIVTGVTLGALLLLALLILGLLSAIRKAQPRMPLSWRFGWQGILREPRASIGQILAFGVTLAAILLSLIIRNELIDTWREQLPEKAPNHFALNIFPDQLTHFKQSLQDKGIQSSPFYPLVRGRLTHINQTPVQQIVTKDSQGERATHRELNLTWSLELPEENTIEAGSWWNQAAPGLVSVEQKLADSLKIKLGDRLTFSSGGQQFVATVANLRALRWESMKPNFYMIFSPGTLEAYPHTLMTSFYLDETNKNALNALAKEFPGMSILEVDRILRQLQTVFRQLTQAVNYLFYLALLAALTVLFAAVYSSLDQRIHENALLRTFGASRAFLRKIQAIEFFCLGAISGLTGVLIAELLSYALYRQVMHIPFHPHLELWLTAPWLSATVVVLSGLWGLRRVTNKPPLRVLREL
ncbi:ABC transporter permease [Methylomicrobium lacus]|uniref:ABC transporter permease n=1 Tax=Methylomicrobium lacus TaxID=136992 RepID=UPI00045EC36A|nr:FtsX-like permease family protein [Methylomicrobium lacus]